MTEVNGKNDVIRYDQPDLPTMSAGPVGATESTVDEEVDAEADVAEAKRKSALSWPRLIISMAAGLAIGVAIILFVSPPVEQDIEQVVLATRAPVYLIIAVLATFVLLAADAWSLVVLVRVIRPEVVWWRVFGVTLEANLVGGATSFGGIEIPYQIVALRMLGLRLSEATSAVMVKGVMHTSVLVVAALMAFIPISGSPITPLQRWILLGVLGSLLVLWVVGTLWTRKPLGLSLLPEPIRRRVRSFVEALSVFRTAGWDVMLKMIGLVFIYWVGMFSLIPLILLALGYRGALLPIIVGQAVLQVLMPLSPLPGGAGVAEFGYLELIGPSTPGSIRVASLILWRILTWILPVALGGLAMGLRGIKQK
ncbi:MAG: flippase-like domain-containing protein [Actinobacteria bacterium]|nr:flippase-like domain-containing protein [Actinomycetota bacterium]